MTGKEPFDLLNRRLGGPQRPSRSFAKKKKYPAPNVIRTPDNPVRSPVNLMGGEGIEPRKRLILLCRA
jgi:hypothetical protein